MDDETSPLGAGERAAGEPGAALEPEAARAARPRAGAHALAEALAGAREFQRRGGGALLRRSLASVVDRLGEHHPPPTSGDPALAAALGLSPAEALRHDPYHPLGWTQWSECASVPLPERDEVALCVPHWGQLDVAFRCTLVQLLAAGRSVVVLAPERLPMPAERAARELARAGLPDGAVHVLVASDELVWRAVEQGGFDVIAAAGHASLETRLRARLASGGAGPSRGSRAPFGAGVVDAMLPALEFERVRSADVHVHVDDDPRERAEAAALLALGRAESLSGQLPGRVGRIRCHPRRFSQLTTALLALLESSPAFAHPLPPFEPEARAELERARELGLDEGATLILEGSRVSSDDDGWGKLFPLVFTNVEPGMRLARLERPMPLLLLLREPAAGEPAGGDPLGATELGPLVGEPRGEEPWP
jgi:hypothetical protein